MGKSLYNNQVGVVAAILSGFSFIYSLYSINIHTDTILQAFVVLSLWQLYEFIKTRKTQNVVLGFVAIGLGMLSKGSNCYGNTRIRNSETFIRQERLSVLLDYRWYTGITIALIITTPALWHLYKDFGTDGIWFFF